MSIIDMIKFFYERGDYTALFCIFLGFVAFVMVMATAAVTLANINIADEKPGGRP